MVRFDATKEEKKLITKIVCKFLTRNNGQLNSFTDIEMDLNATHSNGIPLDFEKLLSFDDFNFYHEHEEEKT